MSGRRGEVGPAVPWSACVVQLWDLSYGLSRLGLSEQCRRPWERLHRLRGREELRGKSALSPVTLQHVVLGK